MFNIRYILIQKLRDLYARGHFLYEHLKDEKTDGFKLKCLNTNKSFELSEELFKELKNIKHFSCTDKLYFDGYGLHVINKTVYQTLKSNTAYALVRATIISSPKSIANIAKELGYKVQTLECYTRNKEELSNVFIERFKELYGVTDYDLNYIPDITLRLITMRSSPEDYMYSTMLFNEYCKNIGLPNLTTNRYWKEVSNES